MKEYKIGEEFRKLTAPSSKGTQEKYCKDGYWYKINNYGEALAEELSAKILSCSNVNNYVDYERCMINGKSGCRSKDFLDKGETFITFQRLYQSYVGGNLSDKIRTFSDITERFNYLVSFVNETTGLDCSNYLRNIFSLDLIIMNPDRHFHNLGIIQMADGSYREAPIFDNGQGLGMNYSITPPYLEIEEKEKAIAAGSISGSFDAQVVAAGNTLKINYDKLYDILSEYPDSPAKEFLIYRLDKYKSMFRQEVTIKVDERY